MVGHRRPPRPASEALPWGLCIDPAICPGKPCVRGLRYPAELLLELLSSGMTAEEILADHADLEPDDLRAATAYAARAVHTRRLQPIG